MFENRKFNSQSFDGLHCHLIELVTFSSPAQSIFNPKFNHNLTESQQVIRIESGIFYFELYAPIKPFVPSEIPISFFTLDGISVATVLPGKTSKS